MLLDKCRLICVGRHSVARHSRSCFRLIAASIRFPCSLYCSIRKTKAACNSGSVHSRLFSSANFGAAGKPNTSVKSDAAPAVLASFISCSMSITPVWRCGAQRLLAGRWAAFSRFHPQSTIERGQIYQPLHVGRVPGLERPELPVLRRLEASLDLPVICTSCERQKASRKY